MKLLQKASYNKGITEVQQETTECQTRGTDIQRVRPRTHIANCNLIGREEKKNTRKLAFFRLLYNATS